MVAISKTLEKEQIRDISLYLATLQKTKNHPPAKGSPKKGKQLFLEHCAKCHRYNASGERTFHSAPLSYFPHWYLRLQYEKFKSGQRSYLPTDIEGAKMKKIASLPLTQTDLCDILAYISECN